MFCSKLTTGLRKIQTNYEKYNNKEILDSILKDGKEKAQIKASQTLSKATKALGLN